VHKIKAAKYFLFFVIPLLIFNYIGALADTDNNGFRTPYNQGFYWFCVIVWELLIFIYVAVRYREPTGMQEREAYKFLVPKHPGLRKCCCGIWGLYSIAAFVIGLTFINAVVKIYDTSYLFLFLLLLLSCVGIFRIGLLRAHLSGGRIFVIGAVAIVGLVFWVLALLNFVTPVTDKSKSPWVSREGNSPCVFLDYFDAHDMWHLEGSFGLFFILLLVLHFNPPVNETADDMQQMKDTTSFGVPLLGSRRGKDDES